MRLAITGASGFLGKNFLLRARKEWRIHAFYNSDASFPGFLQENGIRAEPVKCDLADPAQVKNAFNGLPADFDACLYLAANSDPRASFDDPAGDLRNNAAALINLLEHYRGGRFIFLSSGSVYDGLSGPVSPDSRICPKLPYAISKLASEQYARFYCEKKKTFADCVIVRFFGAFGPFEPKRKVYSKLVTTFALEGRREFDIYGDGTNLIDAMYVDDAVDALQRCVSKDAGSATVDLPGGEPLSIAKLVERAAETFGVVNPIVRTNGTAVEPIRFTADPRPFSQAYGFKRKVALEEGLRKLAAHLKLTAGKAGQPPSNTG